MPRTHVLDGLDGAFDVDRMGLAPEGSTLAVAEASPALFRQHHDRLRLANVRWVLSFHPLPEDLVSLRDEIRFGEVREALRLYELRDPLPRAFFVPSLDGAPPGGWRRVGETAGARVAYEGVDPHTVVLRATTPPGFLVVLDGHHPDWKAEDRSGPVPLQVAFGRYRAIPTRGGDAVVTLRYQPAWRAPALSCSRWGGWPPWCWRSGGRPRQCVAFHQAAGMRRAILSPQGDE